MTFGRGLRALSIASVVLAASEATAPLLAEQGASGPPARWLAILAIYDLTIGLVAYGVFDFLLED